MKKVTRIQKKISFKMAKFKNKNRYQKSRVNSEYKPFELLIPKPN